MPKSRPMSALLTLLFLCAGISLLFFTTTLQSQIHWVILITIKLVLILLCLLTASILFYKTCINKESKCFSAGFGTLFYTMLCSFLLLESIFLFVPQSHHLAFTLAAKRWYNYYWKPINQFKYRDPLVDLSKKPDGDIILAMGDSFTAGYGINDYRDRFSNVLDSKLPLSYQVLNFGINGGDTLSIIRQLRAISFKPALTIVQYHANDILAISHASKKDFPGYYELYSELPIIIKPLIENSYFLNFFYWQIKKDDTKSYSEHLSLCYANKEILTEHLNNIRAVIELNKKLSSKTIFVLFPFLLSPDQSEEHTAIIEILLKQQNIPYINVANLIDDIPPQKRIVNKKDAHPSVLVHKRVAEALYNKMIEIGYITD